MGMLGKRRPARTASRNTASSSPQREHHEGMQAGVNVLRLTHDGRGVARDASGKTLFITQALPGEQVIAAVHRSHRRYDEAHVRERLTTSAERIVPPCPHYVQCGGCDLQHLALDGQRRHKREVLTNQLARQGLMLDQAPALIAADGFGYRRRARLGVKRDAEGRIHLGFRARGSHHLIDITHCPILVPQLEALLPPLQACLEGLQAPRQIGHIELVAGDEGVAVIVRQLRANPGDAHAWQRWAEVQGVSLAQLEGRQEPRLRWVGKAPGLGYTLKSGGRSLQLNFAPGDFLQVNAEVNQKMVATALDWLQPDGNERVLDLFAGVGNFALALAPHVAHVIGVEGSPAMVARLSDNARHNGLYNVEARQGDLTQAPRLDPVPDLVVLDPPRDGAEAVSRALAASRVRRVLYVSCDPATLARDAGHLVHGGYRITRAAVADMFAQTAHLESMLLFERGTG